jgi:hypothetical protein
MDDAIRRAVERLFPELSGKYHLPRFGVVVGVPDAPSGPTLADDFRPRFCVDVQVLDEHDNPDPELPTLHALPLPVPQGGSEAGLFGFPEEGTKVVVCFAYGMPHKPYIQQILSSGLSLPAVPKGDQLWQHSDECNQRVDAEGNWQRNSSGKISDKSSERDIHALDNTEQYQSSSVIVDEHSTESIGGVKKIEAVGALKMLSGGTATLAALDDLNTATGRDHNLVVGQKLNTTVGGDMLERIQGIRRSLAPKTWVGSESVNVLQVLCDLLELVQQMNTQLAGHTHVPGPTPSPTDAAGFNTKAATAGQLSGKLKPITA